MTPTEHSLLYENWQGPLKNGVQEMEDYLRPSTAQAHQIVSEAMQQELGREFPLRISLIQVTILGRPLPEGQQRYIMTLPPMDERLKTQSPTVREKFWAARALINQELQNPSGMEHTRENLVGLARSYIVGALQSDAQTLPPSGQVGR